MAGALRAADFDVEIRPPSGLPSDNEGFEAFDLIAFSEAPASDFSDVQMKTLQTWVANLLAADF